MLNISHSISLFRFASKKDSKSEMELHSTPTLSSKDSKDSLSSPASEIQTSLNSNSNSNQSVVLPLLDKSPPTGGRIQLTRPQGFKMYSSQQQHRENSFPTKEEKLSLKNKLEENLKSNVDLNKVTQWFQVRISYRD